MLRSALVFLHRWAGLVMAGFLIVEGLTGSILAFDTQIDRLINPELFVAAGPGAVPLSLADLAQHAEAAEPHARVEYFALANRGEVVIPMAPRTDPITHKPYVLGFDHVFLDPYTGREIAKRRDGDLSQGRINVMPFLFLLHTSLVAGAWGTWLLGVVALIWTLDCFGAFYLTLPLRRDRFLARWKPSWLVKWPASAFRLNFDLHRAGGLWLWAMLLVFAWSSVMFNLPGVYTPVMRALFATTPFTEQVATLHPTHPTLSPKLDWRAAEARAKLLAEQEARSAGFKVLRPFGMGYLPYLGVYTYDVRSDDDVGGRTWENGVWVDANTGELQKQFLPSRGPLGDRIATWIYALHWADLHNAILYRVFVALLGLAVAGLSATGVYIWLVKRKGRVARKRVPVFARYPVRRIVAAARRGMGGMK